MKVFKYEVSMLHDIFSLYGLFECLLLFLNVCFDELQTNEFC